MCKTKKGICAMTHNGVLAPGITGTKPGLNWGGKHHKKGGYHARKK